MSSHAEKLEVEGVNQNDRKTVYIKERSLGKEGGEEGKLRAQVMGGKMGIELERDGSKKNPERSNIL